MPQKRRLADLDRLRRAHIRRAIVARRQNDQIPKPLHNPLRLPVLQQPILKRAPIQLPPPALVNPPHRAHRPPDPQPRQPIQMPIIQHRPGQMQRRGRKRPERRNRPAQPARRIQHPHIQRPLIRHHPPQTNPPQQRIQRRAAAHRDVLSVVQRHPMLRIHKRKRLPPRKRPPLEKRHRNPRLSKIQRRRQPRQAAANHRNRLRLGRVLHCVTVPEERRIARRRAARV